MPIRQFPTELRGSVDRRVYLAPQRFLSGSQQRRYIGQTNLIADDHHVDVALGPLMMPGHRAEDERDPDFPRQRPHCFPQHSSGSHRLADQPMQFGIDRTILVDLVVCLPPLDCPGQNAAGDQPGKFALNGPGTERKRTDHLTLIEPLVRMVEEKSQHRLPGGPE